MINYIELYLYHHHTQLTDEWFLSYRRDIAHVRVFARLVLLPFFCSLLMLFMFQWIQCGDVRYFICASHVNILCLYYIMYKTIAMTYVYECACAVNIPNEETKKTYKICFFKHSKMTNLVFIQFWIVVMCISVFLLRTIIAIIIMRINDDSISADKWPRATAPFVHSFVLHIQYTSIYIRIYIVDRSFDAISRYLLSTFRWLQGQWANKLIFFFIVFASNP